MAPEGSRQYEIDLKQGDLYIQLFSDDIEFIARQMQRWYEIILDDTYVPVTIPTGDFALPPASITPEPTVIQETSVVVQETSVVTVTSDGTQEMLLSQIKLLQEQVERLVVEKATQPSAPVVPQAPTLIMPEVSNPVDAFIAPAHQDVQPDFSPAPIAVSSGFEQPVENPSMAVQNPAPEAFPEIPQTPAEEAFPPESLPEQGAVENRTEPLDNGSAPPIVEAPSAPTETSGNDLDSLLNSLMTDLEQKSQGAGEPLSAPPVEPPAEASFEAVFTQALSEITETETPLPEAEPSVEIPIPLDLPELPPSPTFMAEEVVTLPAEPEAATWGTSVPTEELPAAPPTTSEWDDLARLKPNEEYVVKREVQTDGQIYEEDEDLNPPFPTPEVAAEAEKGFGISGTPPTDDPKIRKLSMEALQNKPASMDDFISPFPKTQEEVDREAAETAQRAEAEQKLAEEQTRKAQEQQQSSAIEEDLFGAFGAPPAAPAEPEDIFGAFGGGGGFSEPAETAAPAAATVAVAVQPVEHKGAMPQVESLTELCDMAPRATSGSDFMMLTAFFLKRFKEQDKFALKDVNTQLLRSGLTPVNHALLEASISQGLVQLIPDLTGNAHAAEYSLTENGETYVDAMLNY